MKTLKNIPRKFRKIALKLKRIEKRSKKIVWRIVTLVRVFYARKLIEKRGSALQELNFYNSHHFDVGQKHLTKKQSIHADSAITFVLERNNKICGVVSGVLTRSKFSVRQIQGVRRADFHDGTDSSDYMSQCAEEISRALGFSKISVREYCSPEDKLVRKKNIDVDLRKKKIYNETPEKRGYERKYSKLRKRWYRELPLKIKSESRSHFDGIIAQ